MLINGIRRKILSDVDFVCYNDKCYKYSINAWVAGLPVCKIGACKKRKNKKAK